MAGTTLIWTALPAGARRSADGRWVARVSVFVTARLGAPASGAPLSAFTDFVDWPATLRSPGISFIVQVRNDSQPLAERLVRPDFAAAADAPDSDAWSAIFRPSMTVLPFAAPDADPVMKSADGGIETYDAGDVISEVRKAYSGQLASELFPSRDGPSLDAFTVSPADTGGELAANAGALEQFAHFCRSPDRDGDRPRKSAKPDRCTDFHQVVAGLGTHPRLMRVLGLVLDLDIPVGELGLDAVGDGIRIRVTPRDINVEDTEHVRPWTRIEYNTAEGDGFRVFRPAEASGAGHGGFRDLNGEITTIAQEHVEHAAFALMQRQRVAEPGPLPALLQGGMRVFDSTLPATVRSAIAAQTQLERSLRTRLQTRLTAAPNPAGEGAQADPGDDERILHAEDLTRGYRIDVRDVDEGVWRSLCRRANRYRASDWSWPAAGETVEDEGLVEPGVFKDPEAARRSLRVPQDLFTWDGWSLAVPRPDSDAVASASGFVACTEDGDEAPPLDVDSTVPAGSLQPQRFGRCYQFRARTVDLAGNSLSVGEANAIAPGLPAADVATEPQCCLLVESAKPPRVFRAQPRGPGEAGDVIVIRDAESARYRTNAFRLHVVPPEVSVSVAEMHGVFDGVPASDAWRLIETHRGELEHDAQGNARDAIPASEIYTPYLPDPMVRQAVMTLPDGAGSVDLPPFDDLPSAVRGRELARSCQLVIRAGRNELRADVTGRRVTLRVPKGRVQTIRLSARLAEAELAVAAFAHPDWSDAATVNTLRPGLASAAARGEAPTLAPPREVRIVHATQRPLTSPVFNNPTILPRTPRQTGAVLTDERFLFDAPSTGRLDVHARWQDPVDDPRDEAWRVDDNELYAGGMRVDDDDAAPFTGAAPLAARRHPLSHDFGDTKHHEVEYRAVALSQFVEFYPESLTRDARNVTRSSTPVRVHVPSTVPPAAPDIAYVIPTFGRSTHGGDQAEAGQSGYGLRVYLNRGWFSSGAAEQLALIVALPGTPEALRPSTSEWGVNPVRDTAPLPGPLGLAHVASGAETLATWPIDGGEVGLVLHPVRFSAEHGLPFADIEFTSQRAFMPLVRLALARYQPYAIDDCHLSRIARADFVPLAPDRAVTVTRVGNAEWRMVMRGDSYTDPAPDGDGARTSVVQAQIEVMTSTIREDAAAWRPVGEAVTLQPSPADTWRYEWTGGIRLDDAAYLSGQWRRRLVIREFEPFMNAGQSDVPLPERARLISAHALRL